MATATPSNTVALLERDFLAMLLRSPDRPRPVEAASQRRYRRKSYPPHIAPQIGVMVRRLHDDGLICPPSQDQTIAAVAGRSSRRGGLAAVWVIADRAAAKRRVAHINRQIGRPQPGLFDKEATDE